MNASGAAGEDRRARRRLLLLLAYLAFVSLGLPDGVLGLVWPALQSVFELPQAALGVPLAVGAVTYFLSGLLAGRLIHGVGVGVLLAVSTGLVVAGLVAFATAPAFGVFLLGSAIVGFGSGAVDSGLNTYAARHFAARHMSWLHAAYSAGAATGPAIVTALIAAGASFRVSYATLATLLSLLTVAFVLTRRSWTDGAANPDPPRPPPEPAAGVATSVVVAAPAGAWEAARHPRVGLHAALFFLYTGVEIGAGQWSYSILTKSRGVAPEAAGVIVTGYYVAVFVGRVVSGFIVERIGTVRLVRGGMVLAFVGATVFAMAWLPAAVSALGLVLVGLALAPIFPGLMSETPRRVGERVAAHAVGFQVSAATAGVALLPNAAGLLGERYGLDATAAFIAGTTLVLWAVHEVVVRVADGPGRQP